MFRKRDKGKAIKSRNLNSSLETATNLVAKNSNAKTKTSNSNLDVRLKTWHYLNNKYLSGVSWYHDTTTRATAEYKLEKGGRQNGLFLVRRSVVSPEDFVLSFVCDSMYLHYRIQHRAHNMYSLQNCRMFEGIDTLLAAYTKQSTGDLPIKLGHFLVGKPPPPLSVKAGLSNPLHEAIFTGNCSEAVQILQHDDCPDVSSRDENGSTALHLAADGGHLDVAKELIARGASINVANGQSYTPLHCACVHNQAAIARFFLTECNANAQVFDRHTGNVPLHIAAMLGHEDTIQVLLDVAVPVSPRNMANQTPCELATQNSHFSCAKLLDEYRPPEPLTSRSQWFHGDLPREAACELLKKYGLTDGLFLVRNKSDDPTACVLSVCFHGTIRNYVIRSYENAKYYIDDGPLFVSLEHCVEHYHKYACGLEGILTEGIPPEADDNTSGATTLTRLPTLPNLPLPQCPQLSRHDSKFAAIKSQLDKSLILDANSLETVCELGQGEFGSVFQAVWTSENGQKIDVAVKTLNKEHVTTGRENFLQEALVMAKLDYVNIVRLIGICEGPPLMLVQEMLILGSLLDLLLDYPEKIRPQVDMYLWALQIAVGMMYLEQHGFVHRDLAARNILLQSMHQVKLGDFGLSRAIGANSDYYQATKNGRWPVKWYAPESINYGTFLSTSDVWSYGVTLWEMYSFGQQPYDNMTGAEVLAFLERGGRLPQPNASCPSATYQLMTDCWLIKPSDRPTFHQVHKHLRHDDAFQSSLRHVKMIAIRDGYFDDVDFQESYLGPKEKRADLLE